MEEYKNLIVNNKAVAGILSQISQTNVKLSNNIEDDSNYHSYLLPQNLLKNNEKTTLLDTFGILSKSKLLLREPISGSQISFYSADYSHSQADDEKGISLKSENVKNFYSCIFDKLDHKYSSSFFTNLKSNSNVSIIFPNNKSAHLISDSVHQLKSYAKKIFNIKINENQILTSSLPLDISIFEDGELKKTIAIKNKSYLGYDLVTNNLFDKAPTGLTFEMIKVKNFMKIKNRNKDEIEHICNHFYNNKDKFKILAINLKKYKKFKSANFALDNKKDLLNVKKIYKKLKYNFNSKVDQIYQVSKTIN